MCVLRSHQNAAAEAHCFSKLLDVFPLRKLEVALEDDEDDACLCEDYSKKSADVKKNKKSS